MLVNDNEILGWLAVIPLCLLGATIAVLSASSRACDSFRRRWHKATRKFFIDKTGGNGSGFEIFIFQNRRKELPVACDTVNFIMISADEACLSLHPSLHMRDQFGNHLGRNTWIWCHLR